MAEWLSAALIGLASGVMSAMFGIGGGIITTPAIRLLLGVSALAAVGTPLPVIIPSAVTGASSYHRRGLVDLRVGIGTGLAGVVTAVAGAWATRLVGGGVVLIGTAVLIAVAAIDMALQIAAPPAERVAGSGNETSAGHVTTLRIVLTGLLTGFYSGFFGLGGGFVLVPIFTRWLRFPLKRAIGTSLVAVAILAVPGTVTHAVIGNIDWVVAAGLTVGVVPGAMLGARLNAAAHERTVRLGFIALLLLAAGWLAANELMRLT